MAFFIPACTPEGHSILSPQRPAVCDALPACLSPGISWEPAEGPRAGATAAARRRWADGQPEGPAPGRLCRRPERSRGASNTRRPARPAQDLGKGKWLFLN